MRASIWVVVLGIVACSSKQGGEPMRSPTTDYPPPEARTSSDGEILGADRVRPADKLATSPRLGSHGIEPAERPGDHEKDRQAPPPKPCEEIGREGTDGKVDCPANGVP